VAIGLLPLMLSLMLQGGGRGDSKPADRQAHAAERPRAPASGPHLR
jgi:hypothetical protein